MNYNYNLYIEFKLGNLFCSHKKREENPKNSQYINVMRDSKLNSYVLTCHELVLSF